jgi:hypothetical protein
MSRAVTAKHLAEALHYLVQSWGIVQDKRRARAKDDRDKRVDELERRVEKLEGK